MTWRMHSSLRYCVVVQQGLLSAAYSGHIITFDLTLRLCYRVDVVVVGHHLSTW
jgi:hypothetical protein